MTNGSPPRRRAWLLLVVLAAQLLWIELEVATGRRLTATGLPAWLLGLLLASPFLALGWRLLRGRSAMPRVFTVIASVLVVAISMRFDIVLVRERIMGRPLQDGHAELRRQAVTLLRELSAEQEQYRLRHGRYANRPAELLRLTAIWNARTWSIIMEAAADSGWAAELRAGSFRCSIRVRHATAIGPSPPREGIPSCLRKPQPSLRHVLNAVDAAPIPFSVAAIEGHWSQHRADPQRSGRARDTALVARRRWTARIGGEVVAPAAIAGGQVFVGAQGNGEFVALSLSDGVPGYRLRLPNWLHHEPVAIGSVVVAPFGNNEDSPEPQVRFGSAPSGVIALDRSTGREIWRQYTNGSVMTSPVIYARDSLVAVISAAREAVAWHIRDGRQIWRTALPQNSMMGNPLLQDSLLVVGLEETRSCGLDARTGKLLWCIALTGARQRSWGAGHASPALAHGLVLQVVDRGWSWSNPRAWIAEARRLLGLDVWQPRRLLGSTGEQALIAVDPTAKRVRWTVSLGNGTELPQGHIAGTPTIADTIAYTPSPLSGRVVAVRVVDGRVLWSARVRVARGSVTVDDDVVLAATRDTAFVVLDRDSGRIRCRQKLPGPSDRAGLTVAGEMAILTLRTGEVLARPMREWRSCRA